MQIIYKDENKEEFLRRWLEYINSDLASYKYTLLNLEYFVLYSQYLIEKSLPLKWRIISED